MTTSIGSFGGESILFIKPDNAIELVKIANLLNIDLKALTPKASTGGKPLHAKNVIVDLAPCDYCGKERRGGLKKKGWRHNCGDKPCRAAYNRDLYDRKLGNDHKIEERDRARLHDRQRKVLAQNLREQGLKVTVK